MRSTRRRFLLPLVFSVFLIEVISGTVVARDNTSELETRGPKRGALLISGGGDKSILPPSVELVHECRPTATDVASSIEELVDNGRLVGAQVVLGNAQSLRLAESFGVRSVEDQTPVDNDTLFCIGSCSKMFAASVIMTLVSDGTLELDVPIDRWLPEFSQPMTENGPAKRAPTLRELLCHRAGVYSQKNRMTPSRTRWIRDYELTLAESVSGIGTEKLLGEPGQQYMYSGAGYCVLGRVAEVATGVSFDDLLKKRICEPLGISATSYFPPVGHPNVAVGHQLDSGKFVVTSSTPHLLGTRHKMALVGGSLYCPAREAARFAQMLLQEGSYDGKPVLSRAQWQEMTKPQSPREDGGYGFGLHIRVDDNTGQLVVLSHGGSLSGSYSYMMMNFETKRFGVVTYTGRRSKSTIGDLLATWCSGPAIL